MANSRLYSRERSSNLSAIRDRMNMMQEKTVQHSLAIKKIHLKNETCYVYVKLFLLICTVELDHQRPVVTLRAVPG